jgi:hypothetical protein
VLVPLGAYALVISRFGYQGVTAASVQFLSDVLL